MDARRIAASCGALAISAGLVAACSSSVSQSDVQDVIKAGLSAQDGGDYMVTCPSDIPVQDGGTFACDAIASDGTALQVIVTQHDDQGGVGISWAVDDGS